MSSSKIQHGRIDRNHQIRLWVKSIMVLLIETIKFVFEWIPSWSYGSEPSNQFSSEIQKGSLLVKMCLSELWNEFYWFFSSSEIPSNSSNIRYIYIYITRYLRKKSKFFSDGGQDKIKTTERIVVIFLQWHFYRNSGPLARDFFYLNKNWLFCGLF